ncbi:CFEM domain-containing protein [Diaporthe helianthi]|uniref:CFEM domain-containing protein n=1 Tax=Diaporthe helianthi TaxID=158607 RepID=A0A2P5HTL5_DIAHE|nr:CFEM domain-containing protein [Diaporthe helianthi]
MLAPWATLLVLLSLVQLAFSQASVLAGVPGCALSCLLETLTSPESPCPITNQTCICQSTALQANVSSCVLEACTVKEALTTLNISSTTCNVPVRDNRLVLDSISYAMLALSSVVVGIRFYVRSFMGDAGSIGTDDWIILATLVLGIPSTLLATLGAGGHGLGRDIWTLSFDEITMFAKYFYVLQTLYVVGLPMVKVSLLFFYLRVFPARPIRRVLWGTIVLISMYSFAFMFVSIFECAPISYFWESWDGEHKGKCLDLQAISWAQAAVSIVLDLWMLAIPLSQLPALKLHWKKKLSVGFMFFIGTFVTVVSILRLQSLMKYANSTNVTWDNTPVAIWSTIELNVGMICTSLPTLRLLAVKVWPVLNGSTIRSKFGYSGSRYGRSRYPKRSTDISSSGDGPLRLNSLKKIPEVKVDDAFPPPPDRVSDVGSRPSAPDPIHFGLSRSSSEMHSVHTFTSQHKLHKYSTSVPIRSASMPRRDVFDEISEIPPAGHGISRGHNNTLMVEDSVTVRSGRTGNSTIGGIVETYATMSSPMEYSMPVAYPEWPLNEPDNVPLPRGWPPEQQRQTQTMFPIGEAASSSSDLEDNEGRG